MSQNLFVSNRDVNIGTTLGHSILFKKGVPQAAPREVHHLLIERGILPVDDAGEIETKKIDELVLEPSAPKMAPEDALERADVILEAIKLIVKRNNAKDFSGSTPSADTVSRMVGWHVDQKETRKVWTDNRSKILGQPQE